MPGGIDEPVVGAQAGGYNLVSTGVAILGDFGTALPSEPAFAALQQLLAWKLSLHGVPITGQVTVRVDPAGAVYSRFPAGAAVVLPHIAGHRDGDSTDCPGDALYAQLPAVRRRARLLAGRPLLATLTATASALTAPGPATLSGTLTALDGTPVPDAAVALQSRALAGAAGGPLETTVAELITDAGGRFAAALPVSFNASLRALFAGATGLPATVSVPLDLSVAPALTLTTPVGRRRHRRAGHAERDGVAAGGPGARDRLAAAVRREPRDGLDASSPGDRRRLRADVQPGAPRSVSLRGPYARRRAPGGRCVDAGHGHRRLTAW